METKFIIVRTLWLFCIVSICLLHTPGQAHSQIKPVRFEHLDSLLTIQKRGIVVFIHTSWCKFCHRFQETTLKSARVQKLLNNEFYFVDLDAECKTDIVFRNHTFRYDPVHRLHDLARELGTKNDQVSYPTITFLNTNFKILHQQDGYISEKNLLPVLEKLARQNSIEN